MSKSEYEELIFPREHARLKGSVENWNWISFDEEASALIMVGAHHAWLVSYPSLEVLSSLQHDDNFIEVAPVGNRKYVVAAVNEGIELLDATHSPQMSMEHIPGEDAILTLAVSPDKKKIYTAGYDRTLTCLTYPNFETLWSVDFGEEEIESIALSADGQRLCIGDNGGVIRILDCKSKKVIHESQQASRITAVSLHPEQPLVLFGEASGAFVSYDYETGEEGFGDYPLGFRPLEYSPDGLIGVAASMKGLIYIWNVELNLLLYWFGIPARHDEIFPFCFTPDSKYLITGGAPPNALHVWDLTQPADSSKPPLQYHVTD